MEDEDKGFWMLVLATVLALPNMILVPVQYAVTDETWSWVIVIAGFAILAVQVALLIAGKRLIDRSL